MSILLFFVALQARKIVQLFGNSQVMLVGLFLVFVSAVGLAVFAGLTNYWYIFPFTLTFGAGFALALTPLTSSAMADIPENISGAASGVYNTTRQFGAALGLALGLVVTSGTTSVIHIFQNVMILAAILLIMGILFVMTLVLRKSRVEDEDQI